MAILQNFDWYIDNFDISISHYQFNFQQKTDLGLFPPFMDFKQLFTFFFLHSCSFVKMHFLENLSKHYKRS